MGTLVGYHYASTLFLKLADHTYVACGTLGKAWACWGGKTGGAPLRQAPGSSKRADAIAEPDERAGITCYLVNGVCHQAANRILLPAGITVQGARGYGVSTALFGVYGRPRGILGFCRAPFDRHPGVVGDLAACIAAAGGGGGGGGGAIRDGGSGTGDEGDPRERAFLERSLRLHESAEGALMETASPDAIVRYQLSQFALFVDYKLGDAPMHREFAAGKGHDALMSIREETERERLAAEQRFAESGDVDVFREADDALTLQFQQRVGKLMDGERYAALLDQAPGDDVTLADPEILAHAYRDRPAPGA